MLGNSIGDKIAEGDDGQNPIVREGVVAFDIKELHQMTTTGAGVNANRDIEFFRQGIDGTEVRIVQSQIAFHTAEENSDGALLFRPLHFF